MVKNDINQFHKQGILELNMQKFTWKLKKLGLCKDPNTNESKWKRKKNEENQCLCSNDTKIVQEQKSSFKTEKFDTNLTVN
jgi:hypothetical protein